MKKGYKKPNLEPIEIGKEICLNTSGGEGTIDGQTTNWDKTH